MKEVLLDRRMAWAIALLVITASVLTGTQRSLNNIKRQAAAIFTNGAIIEGESIETDLLSRIDYAQNLIDAAQGYLNGESETLTLLMASRQELIDAKRVYEKYAANERLSQAADIAVTTLLEQEGLTQTDKNKIEMLDTYLKARNKTIATEADVYNEKAREYNKYLDAFPGIITKALKMNAALELYEEV